MRPIKFRAWHFKLNRMFTAEEMTQDQMALLPDGHFANIHGADTTKSTIYPHTSMMPMQFTGLHDKNGKEIYEGDIIESVSEMVRLSTNEKTGKMYRKVCSVVYVPERAQFATQLSTGHIESGFGMSQEIIVKWYEVIGNIYENPELLSGT